MLLGISGITSQKQVGKNTVASMIAYILDSRSSKTIYSLDSWNRITNNGKELNNVRCRRATIESFAHKLKLIVCTLTGCNICDLEKSDFKEYKKVPEYLGDYTFRQFLQCLGTDIFRKINPNIWAEALLTEYDYYKKKWDTIDWIVSDVRFKNEADAIKKRGGYVVGIRRNTVYSDRHPSEKDMEDYNKFDFYIDNTSTFEELFDNCNKLCSTLIYRKIYEL